MRKAEKIKAADIAFFKCVFANEKRRKNK